MRQLDLSPLYRSTIGFDRLLNLVDQAAGFEAVPSYPPYNIERTAEDAYRITIAVAGFSDNELSVETKENSVVIRGSKEARVESEPAQREVLYQGIAARAFERRFQLADHVFVKTASLENGLLHVDLVRELPEAQKPRQVTIGKPGPKVVEGGSGSAKAA